MSVRSWAPADVFASVTTDSKNKILISYMRRPSQSVVWCVGRAGGLESLSSSRLLPQRPPVVQDQLVPVCVLT